MQSKGQHQSDAEPLLCQPACRSRSEHSSDGLPRFSSMLRRPTMFGLPLRSVQCSRAPMPTAHTQYVSSAAAAACSMRTCIDAIGTQASFIAVLSIHTLAAIAGCIFPTSTKLKKGTCDKSSQDKCSHHGNHGDHLHYTWSHHESSGQEVTTCHGTSSSRTMNTAPIWASCSSQLRLAAKTGRTATRNKVAKLKENLRHDNGVSEGLSLACSALEN